MTKHLDGVFLISSSNSCSPAQDLDEVLPHVRPGCHPALITQEVERHHIDGMDDRLSHDDSKLYSAAAGLSLSSIPSPELHPRGLLAKQVLKWMRHHSNTAAIRALYVPMMRYRILSKKLGFLLRVVKSNLVTMTGRVMLVLCDDAD